MFGRRREGWIGVDRGTGAMKVAQLRRVGGATRVEVAALTPRWPESTDHLLVDEKGCQHELDTVRALAGSWRSRTAAATASMNLCTLSTSDEERPESSAPACSDSWAVGERDAYTLSIPEQAVSTLCEGLRLSGLRCRVIDGAPLAIARALRMTLAEEPDRLIAGLDWGVSSATLVAAKQGRAVYARKLNDCGFGAALESIASNLGLATFEAETLVRRHGVADATSSGVAATVADALSHAASAVLIEARRTLSHLASKLKISGPERLWGLGIGATPPGLTRLIGDRLDLPAEPWRPAAVGVDSSIDAPLCLFGQAIALSCLAWERQSP